MSGYEWQGGIANGGFVRGGNRNRNIPGDKERGERLYALLADTPFWCANCGGMHALREHRICRADFPFRTAIRGAT